MPLILRHFPDTIVRVAGYDITKANTFYDKLKMTGYGLYIKRLIKKLKLDGKVTFTGNLNAEEMKNEYLKSNVFICPSTIENSPNSLGEAQILGVPCIASYVGGIPDMMDGNEENLYRFEEVEMLAEKVCRIFSNEGDQKNMIETAQMRHDPATNGNKLYSIYKSLKG
jgi:glycosyltransferase involved in cell wall biosynthesis